MSRPHRRTLLAVFAAALVALAAARERKPERHEEEGAQAGPVDQAVSDAGRLAAEEPERPVEPRQRRRSEHPAALGAIPQIVAGLQQAAAGLTALQSAVANP